MTPRPLWAGRTLALLGIVLVSLTLRTAVSSISPILAQVSHDIPLDSVAIGILGGVAPIVFALAAIFAPSLAHRIGLERLMTIGIVAMVAGHALRAAAGTFPVLLLGTAVTLAGAGIGNVLLPPLVKRYFPDRVGLLTSLYALLLAVSAAVPALIATPVADSAGWRTSLAVWSLFSVVAAVPWVTLLAQQRRERRAAAAADEAPELAEPDQQLAGRIWRSRVAWRIAICFSVSSIAVYAGFAWLPSLLVETAGVTPAAAGAYLALTSIIGAPSAIVVPLLTTRLRRVSLLVEFGILCLAGAHLGLLLIPGTLTWLWVVLIGLGPLVFPVCLTLINLRTRTQRGSVALSGFAQAIGYTLGALGPVLVGVLHSASGGWSVPLLLLLATTIPGAIAGLGISKRVFVEDELAERA